MNDNQTTWTDLGPTADYPAETHRCIDAGGEPLIVFHVAGAYHVMANVCPHAGLPLGDGERRGMTITCPYHAYTYHIARGTDLDDPEFGTPATMYPTCVDGNRLRCNLRPNDAG